MVIMSDCIDCKKTKKKSDEWHMAWMSAEYANDFFVAALVQIKEDMSNFEGAQLREKIEGTVCAALKAPPCPDPQ